MAIDNSLYDSLETTYKKMEDYFNNNQLGREHSAMLLKHEDLAHLLEKLDIEAIEEQSKDINSLHEQLNEITAVSQRVVEELASHDDSITIATNVVNGLDEIFSKITKVII